MADVQWSTAVFSHRQCDRPPRSVRRFSVINLIDSVICRRVRCSIAFRRFPPGENSPRTCNVPRSPYAISTRYIACSHDVIIAITRWCCTRRSILGVLSNAWLIGVTEYAVQYTSKLVFNTKWKCIACCNIDIPSLVFTGGAVAQPCVNIHWLSQWEPFILTPTELTSLSLKNCHR